MTRLHYLKLLAMEQAKLKQAILPSHEVSYREHKEKEAMRMEKIWQAERKIQL